MYCIAYLQAIIYCTQGVSSLHKIVRITAYLQGISVRSKIVLKAYLYVVYYCTQGVSVQHKIRYALHIHKAPCTVHKAYLHYIRHVMQGVCSRHISQVCTAYIQSCTAYLHDRALVCTSPHICRAAHVLHGISWSIYAVQHMCCTAYVGLHGTTYAVEHIFPRHMWLRCTA